MEGPEIYLEALGVTLDCAMAQGEGAVLDPEHRSYVNHEIFFFSSAEQKEVFDREPFRHCGPVTDPVSRKRFTPTADSPRRDFMERPYYFDSEATLAMFAATPDSFAVPRLRMVPKAGE